MPVPMIPRLNFAIPSGRIRDALAPTLRDFDLLPDTEEQSRKLITPAPRETFASLPTGGVRGRRESFRQVDIIDVKPSDVPMMVARGVTPIAICGPDVWDQNACLFSDRVAVQKDVVVPGPELRFSLIGKTSQRKELSRIESSLDNGLSPTFKVATAYPRLSVDTLEEALVLTQSGRLALEIVRMNGRVELAPLIMGILATDLVETGQTLQQNALVELRVLRRWQGYKLIYNREYNEENPDRLADLFKVFSTVRATYQYNPDAQKVEKVNPLVSAQAPERKIYRAFAAG